MKLTAIFIEKYKPTGKKHLVYDDRTGFCMQVLPTGTKTFYHVFKVDGKRYRINLGQYDPKYRDNNGHGSLAIALEKYNKNLLLLGKGIVPNLLTSF